MKVERVHTRTVAGALLVAAAFALLSGLPVQAADNARPTKDERMLRLSGERGCTLCHRAAPAPPEAAVATPLAPSWREIAARYRGRPGAESRLAKSVLRGVDPAKRHWKDRLEFTQMGGNAPRMSADEARALVRWILATP